MSKTEKCPNCYLEFEAEVYVNGHCPRCEKMYVWDSACVGTPDEYDWIDWIED